MVGRQEHQACPWRALPTADRGKIERWHQTLKNRILLENYYLRGDLDATIGRFVDHYNHAAITRA
jgi:transposase InsO family protein